MVITGEYVVKGLFHHCVVKGGLFHPVNLFFCPRPRTQRELSALGTPFIEGMACTMMISCCLFCFCSTHVSVDIQYARFIVP